MQIQIKMNKSGISKIISIILIFNYLFSDTNNQLEAEIHVPILQQLSIISQLQFDNLKSSHLDQGYDILKGCIELEVKSNTSWSLIVYNEKPTNNNNFFVKTSSSTFIPITEQETQLLSNIQSTAGTLISIDCKRLVSWDSSRPQKWSFSPIFKLNVLE